MTNAWTEGLMELLFPTQANCMGCGSPLGTNGGWLCDECLKKLIPMRLSERPRCPLCGHFLHKGACSCCMHWENHMLSMARSAFSYEPPVSGVVTRMKYGGVTKMRDWMASLMAEAIAEEGMPRPDALVPVPMHRRRLRERGYNQSALLAKSLSARTGVPVMEALVRTRYTKQQARLGAAQRRRNLDNAFRVVLPVRGLRLMLVDDVLTTGTTASKCAVALSEAGAFDVTLITFAAAQ